MAYMFNDDKSKAYASGVLVSKQYTVKNSGSTPTSQQVTLNPSDFGAKNFAIGTDLAMLASVTAMNPSTGITNVISDPKYSMSIRGASATILIPTTSETVGKDWTVHVLMFIPEGLM